MADDYLLDDHRDEAERRLRMLAGLDDPWTIAHLESIGVAPGWRCLEVGAGAGSIALWLGERVGREGHVVATDLEVAALEALGTRRVEVRRHDIAADPLEESAFDLVHVRSVLMHLPGREAVLGKLVRALAPGGWILAEEPDAATDAADPSAAAVQSELYGKAIAAVYDFAESRGLDPGFGGRLLGLLREQGLESVHAEGRVPFFVGGTEPRSAHTPALAEIRDLVVAEGAIDGDEYDAFLALADDPDFAWRESVMISVRGRRPG